MTNVSVRHEPHTYERGNGRSFFMDLARHAALHDNAATERLRRHQLEVDVDAIGDPDLSQQQRDQMAQLGVSFESRALNTLALSGGEFSPPAWFVQYTPEPARAGRVVADIIDQAGNLIPLPTGISSVSVPRLTTGSSVNVPPGEGVAITETDWVTTSITSEVVTMAGEIDMSQQVYDQTPTPGMDHIANVGLENAYNRQLELDLLAGVGGTGPGGHLLGLSQVSGIVSIDASGGTTWTLSYPFFSKVAAQVGIARLLPPEAWILAPRRWFFMAGSQDTATGPTSPLGSYGVHTVSPAESAAGGAVPFGALVSLPVYVSGGIPSGAGADYALCVRPAELLLWEGQPYYRAMVNSLGGTLQIRVQLHRYVAAVLGRFPSGIGVLTGLPAVVGYGS